jgi:hypothetical protein
MIEGQGRNDSGEGDLDGNGAHMNISAQHKEGIERPGSLITGFFLICIA